MKLATGADADWAPPVKGSPAARCPRQTTKLCQSSEASKDGYAGQRKGHVHQFRTASLARRCDDGRTLHHWTRRIRSRSVRAAAPVTGSTATLARPVSHRASSTSSASLSSGPPRPRPNGAAAAVPTAQNGDFPALVTGFPAKLRRPPRGRIGVAYARSSAVKDRKRIGPVTAPGVVRRQAQNGRSAVIGPVAAGTPERRPGCRPRMVDHRGQPRASTRNPS